jgi:hypothetical protein
LEDVTIVGAPKSGNSWPSYAINSYGTLKVDGLTVTSSHGAIALFGDAVVENANITMNGWGGSSHVFYIGGDGTDVVINSGNYIHAGNGDGSLAYIMTGATVTVNGGTFSASNGGYGMATYTGSLIVNGGTFANAFLDWGGPITISGGTFATRPADKYIVDGYKAEKNADGSYSVFFPQESFNDLIENAGENATIEIPAGEFTFPASKLQAGQTLNCAPGTVFEGKSAMDINGATVIGATFSNPDDVAGAGTIHGTFKDCVFEGSEVLRWCYSNEGETVVFENCVFKTDFRGVHFDNMKGNVIFKNCEINGFNAIGGDGTVTFEGCTFGYDESRYNGLNMYSNTVLIDCEFNYVSGKTNFIDFEKAGKSLTITNCSATLDGKAADVLDFVGGTHKNATKIVVNGVTAASDAASLKEGLAADEDVVLMKDIKVTGEKTADRNNYVEAYGNKVGFAQYAGVLDGNGHTITDAEGDKSYLIVTHGGTIKNVIIKTGARGIVTYAPTEDVYIHNVIVDGAGYALNSTEHGNVNMYVTNSTINGWTSLAGFKSVNFTNCKLGENSAKYWQSMGYGRDYDRLFRVYSPTNYTNCEFEQGYYLDLSAGGTANLTDCTVNGVELTAENYADYITIELASGKTLAESVTFG